MSMLLHGDLTERILGIFFAVYKELGTGFLESVYEQAMDIALVEAGLEIVRQPVYNAHFRGRVIGEFRADMVVESKVILELKAARSICAEHEAQIMNYLRATNLEVGLLLNFGPKPDFRRFVYANERKQIRSSI
jgi:GxxExxY protein